jgi:poly-gamma-glutamate capsule biosynthesis protein CapA/YwtB (metallophosphatase superfamily)
MTSRIVVIAAVLTCLAAAPTGQTPARPPATSADAGTFTMALTGDSIITRRLSPFQEPSFLQLIDLIRNADVAFTNLEMLFHDYETYAMNESGGTYMRAEPALAKELAWAGFDLVARANNHTGDYAPEAMRLTTKYVAEAGLVGAGVGETLSEAREPHFVDTAKARVALVACASTFPDHSRAGESRGNIPGRPGLSPLRFTTTYVTTADGLAKLRDGMTAAGIGGRGGRAGGAAAGGAAGGAPAPPQSLTVFGQRVVVGDKPGVRTEPNKEDLEQIAASVRSASKLADYTIVTIHAHEGGQGGRLVPAEFLVTFARAMIDAGADVFVGHGPHVLRGIEIYKGKPILYSLGDFIFQNETLLRLPSENYESYDLGIGAHVAEFNDRRYSGDTRGFPADPPIWESVVAMPRFKGKTLVDLVLQPIALGFGKPASQRGRPMLADPELRKKILDDLIKLSEPFGTKIENRNGVGYVVMK